MFYLNKINIDFDDEATWKQVFLYTLDTLCKENRFNFLNFFISSISMKNSLILLQIFHLDRRDDVVFCPKTAKFPCKRTISNQ